MTKNLRTLALAAVAAISLGLAGCGSDADTAPEAQQSDSVESGNERTPPEPTCEVLESDDTLRPLGGNTTRGGQPIMATPTLTGSSTDILTEQRHKVPQLLADESVEWSDTEYLVGWAGNSEREEAPDTLEGVRLATSDSSGFSNCEILEATSVERVDHGTKVVSYRVTFPGAPTNLGHGTIVFDHPFGEDTLVGSDVWSLSDDSIPGDTGRLLQSAVDQDSIARTGQ